MFVLMNFDSSKCLLWGCAVIFIYFYYYSFCWGSAPWWSTEKCLPWVLLLALTVVLENIIFAQCVLIVRFPTTMVWEVHVFFLIVRTMFEMYPFCQYSVCIRPDVQHSLWVSMKWGHFGIMVLHTDGKGSIFFFLSHSLCSWFFLCYNKHSSISWRICLDESVLSSEDAAYL